MDLSDPAQLAKNVDTFATKKANLDCWDLERTQFWDVTHEVDDGRILFGKLHKDFFVHQYSGKLFRNAEFCTMKSILVSHLDNWRTFVKNCADMHNNLCKLNCRSHVAEWCIVVMILGLTQALTRIGCLQEFGSGPTVEEPCPEEMAEYDQVY